MKKGTANILKKTKLLKAKKERDKESLFIAEGIRFVNEIPKSYTIKFYAVNRSFDENNDLSVYEKRAEVYVFEDKEFLQLCDTKTPQGILAVCEKKEFDAERVICENSNSGFFIIAEELSDPGNLGTVIRTADACGADGVILSKGCVDLYNSKVLRSTMGSIFHLPIVAEADLKQVFGILKEENIKLYAAHLNGKKTPYNFDLKNKTAFLIGNEAKGLKEETAKMADEYLKIPMPGKAESLNASVAAAVLMYETVRQRETEK